MEAYRTFRGNLVALSEMTASGLKNAPSVIFEQAAAGPVVITRHKKPVGVFLSYREFEALVQARQPSLATLENEFDELLAGMQTKKSKAGVSAAFADSSTQLGKAAVIAAKNG